ncbi:MAG: nitrogen regulation protein NR(I) [unclassified Hahellaceae]|nr:nitrogen regulation protein NR(I) [Hahellaceae bacterium]|tara:strand:- start:43498 stop:44946 length:1449 start_codon:yes stop_codon:yes gene_type:complete
MTESSPVWIIDDDRSIRWVLEKAMEQEGIAFESFESGDTILSRLQREQPLAIISDVRMPGINGLELLQRLQEQYPGIPVIIMTAHSDLDSAVSSYQKGAFDYLPKPFDLDEAIVIIKRALAHATGNQNRIGEPSEQQKQKSPPIIGEAPAMQEVFRAIGRLSHSNITVLINGESGTGKELVAKALHEHSPRAGHAFIALNMAAIPKDLIESELFGHEKGAFTGAGGQRIGRFEQASGGTLFLDEIGDMPADTQTRLLRVLADGEFYRIGATTPVKADVRIVAATHQNLEKLVESGAFREDLFHRLNVIRIHLPALRERREDIPRLAAHFLEQAAAELGTENKLLAGETEALLCQLPWPGNVRQLQNTCRWLTVMASGRTIHLGDLPPELQNETPNKTTTIDWPESLRLWSEKQLLTRKEGLLDVAMPIFERVMIESALRQSGGRKKDAAILLGWGRNTLTRKMKELDMAGVDDNGGGDSWDD